MGNKFCSCYKPKVDVESTGRRPGLFKNIKVRIFGGKKDATVSIETSATTQAETANKQEEVCGKIERASLFCVTPNRQAVSCNARVLPIEQKARPTHKTSASMLPHQKLVPESKVKCGTAGVTSTSSEESVAVSKQTEEQTRSDNIQATTFCQTEPTQPLIADGVPDDDIPNKKEALLDTACLPTTDDNIATPEPGEDNKNNESTLIKTSDLAASVPASIEDFEPKTVIPECKCASTTTADKTLTDSGYYKALNHGNDLTENDNELNTTNDKTAPEPASTENLQSQTGISNEESTPILTSNETTTYIDCDTAIDLRKDQTDRDEGQPACSSQTAPVPASREVLGSQTGILDRKRAPDFIADSDDTTADNDFNSTNDHEKDLTDNNVGLNSTINQPARVNFSMEAVEIQTVTADTKSSPHLNAIDTTTKDDKNVNLDHGKYLREKNEDNPTAEKSVFTQVSEKDTKPNRNRDIPVKKAESNTNDITIIRSEDVVASAIKGELKDTDPTEKMTFERVESTHVNNTKVFPSPVCFTTTSTFTDRETTSTIAPKGIANNLCKDGVYSAKIAYDIPNNSLSVPRDQENKTENVINGKSTVHAATPTIRESNLATRTSISYKYMTDTTTSRGSNETTSNQRKIPKATSTSASTSVNIQPLSTLTEGMVDKSFKGSAQVMGKTIEIERDPSKATNTNSFINSLEKNKISKALSEIPTFKAGNSGTRTVSQTSSVFDHSKSVSSTKTIMSGKEKAGSDMRKVTSSQTPSVSSTEALKTLRKLAKILSVANSSADLVSKLTDDKSSEQRVKQKYERPASSMSLTAATTKTSIHATDQFPLLPGSNDPPRKNITKCQSLPAVVKSRGIKKVSDFVVPKTEKASPMKPLNIKPQPKHLYAVPAIAKTDIENEAKKNWTQHDSTSDKAQMPWMSRRPQFDVTFPKPGKTLLQSLGSVDKILAHRVVPLPKRIERLKVDFGRFPGLRIKPNDVRRYPSIFNLTPSQTCLHEETDEHEEGR